MEQSEIQKLIANGESDTLEFKKSTAQLSAAFETIFAFLNGKGGTLLIGVTNGQKVVGQQVTDNTQQEIANEINKLEPHAEINVQYIAIPHDKQIIVIFVKPGIHAPYVYNGRPFQRNQSTTTQMSQHHYEQLLVNRGQLNHSWEILPSNSHYISSLDSLELYRAIKQGVYANRIPADALQESIEDALTRLNLFKDGFITNAAVVLFAKEVLPDYPQCMIKMARFTGTDNLGDFIDNQQIYGNAFKILTAADTFIRKHITIASLFNKDSFERTDRPALPVLAVREALVNAICHRDYAIKESAIMLEIFDDRIEIWNNGKLPPQLQVEDLSKKHRSFPRNKLISNVFYNRGLIEGWGTGTSRIFTLCREHGIPEPKFLEYSSGLSIVLRFGAPLLSGHSSVTKHSQLNVRQEEILSLLQIDKTLDASMIHAKLQNPPSLRTVKADLLVLQKLGLVEQKGKGRSTVWKLKN